MKKKRITKAALALSVALIVVWSMLGTASTIAWFSDNDVVVNTFQFGELNVELYRKVGSSYEEVTEMTRLFEDEALYEPGYTQVVYLKVRNAGEITFDYKLSVLPSNIVDGISVLGQPLHLPDYLKFGLVVADTEEEVLAATKDRATARSYADTALNNYDKLQTDLAGGAEQFVALVVCMPETVGNEANFRVKAASVDLSVKVLATQVEARGQ